MTFPRSLYVYALLVIVVSISLSFHWQFRPRVDAGAYNAIGWNLARGYGYIEHEENRHMPEMDDAIVRVGPGYEFFLGGVYKLFGHKVSLVWVLQALLHAANMFFVYALMRMVFPQTGERAALLASVLFGFAPDLVFINSMLLSESLFLCAMLGALVASYRYMDTLETMGSFVSGFLWALAILIRPVALLPFFAWVVWVWARHKRSHVFLVILMPLVLIGAWSYHVSTRYHSFILTTTAGGYDIWVGNHLGATGGFDKTPEIQAFRDANHSVIVDRVGREKYIAFIKEHPIAFVNLQIKKASLYFSLIRPTGFWLDLQFFPIDRLLLIFSSAVWTAILFILGLAGYAATLYLKGRDPKAQFFLLCAALQPIAVIPIIVDTRYRYALFPFLAILAAYLWHTYKEADKRITYRGLQWSLAILCFATGYDVSLHAREIIQKIPTLIP